MKKLLNINIVTYVPRDAEHRTMMEIKDSLLPTLLYNDMAMDIILNVIINNDDTNEAYSNLACYIGKWIEHSKSNAKYRIIQTTENNLMRARNRLLELAFDNPSSYTMQLDDDDKMLPTWYKFLEAVSNSYILDEDKLNFYMFKWERDDGDFYMPKDIKTKPIEELGRSTFTFSNWGWIAKTSYLMKNGLMYPDFIDSPKLDDNYFHLRSYIMNPEANYILCPIYVWNNKANKSSVSNRKHEFVDDLMDYMKAGNPGYKITPYVIRDEYITPLHDLKDFSYPLEHIMEVYAKGKGHLSKPGLMFDELEMCYKYLGHRLRNIISAIDFMKLYSTFQLRLLGKAYGKVFKDLHTEITIPNGRTENGNPDWKLAEGIYFAEFE